MHPLVLTLFIKPTQRRGNDGRTWPVGRPHDRLALVSKLSLQDRYTLKGSDKRPGTGVIRTFDEGAVLTIKDLLTLMIIVSDNTATDVMFAKVGGTEPVNQLIKTYGLNTIRATGTAEAWFKARDAYANRSEFLNQRKTPYGLSSPRGDR